MFKAGKPCVSILNNPLLLLSLLLPLSQAALSQTREASSRLVDCKYISPDGARYDFTSVSDLTPWYRLYMRAPSASMMADFPCAFS